MKKSLIILIVLQLGFLFGVNDFAVFAAEYQAPKLDMKILSIEIENGAIDVITDYGDTMLTSEWVGTRIKVTIELKNNTDEKISLEKNWLNHFSIYYAYKGRKYRDEIQRKIGDEEYIPPRGARIDYFYFRPNALNDFPKLIENGYGHFLLEILSSITMVFERYNDLNEESVLRVETDLTDWNNISISRIIRVNKSESYRSIEFYRGPLNKIQPYQLKYDDISISKIKTK